MKKAERPGGLMTPASFTLELRKPTEIRSIPCYMSTKSCILRMWQRFSQVSSRFTMNPKSPILPFWSGKTSSSPWKIATLPLFGSLWPFKKVPFVEVSRT